MTLVLYVWCMASATLGAAISIVMKMQYEKSLSKRSNLQWSMKQFFSDDWLTMLSNQLVIVLALVLCDELIGLDSKVMDHIKFLFALIGFSGNSIALAVFSKATQRAFGGVDFKTTIADTTTNTLDAPTPAVLPTDKPKTP